MEMDSVLHFLENKSILVTGATGFVAKIFVEKILRVQPNVKKLYLLVRAEDSKSALRRINTEVISKDLFRVLKEKWGENLHTQILWKVTPVAGDITCENLGVNDTNLLEEMWKEVDCVVNIAATTNYDERYDAALALNTFGAMHVYNFARKCAKIKVLLHVSTAYVSGENPGLILESPYYMGETLNGTSEVLDIETEKKVVEERLNELRDEKASDKEITLAMKDFGIQRARRYGWPNTYVFTKALGEMLLGQLNQNNLPLVILRPTVITSTYREPFPGWVEGIKAIDSIVVAYGKGKLSCFLGDPDCVIDLIPADMVVNAMIATMACHANEACETIYHVGSSLSNPIVYDNIRDYALRYFSKNPWINKDGKAVQYGQVKLFTTMDSFQRYIAIRYLIPLKGLQLVNTTLCHLFQGTYLDLSRKIKHVLRLIELYKPYLFFKGVYDDMNSEKLRMAIREKCVESDIFYFDPKCINWENYFINIHIPGLVKYVFK